MQERYPRNIPEHYLQESMVSVKLQNVDQQVYSSKLVLATYIFLEWFQNLQRTDIKFFPVQQRMGRWLMGDVTTA